MAQTADHPAAKILKLFRGSPSRIEKRRRRRSRPSQPVRPRSQRPDWWRYPDSIRKPPKFQQVTAFSRWCPKTRETEPRPWRLRVGDEARNQRNRLITHYPEALLGDPDTYNLLVDEIADSRRPDELPVAGNTCRMATGEISDLSDPTTVTGHPVFAIVVGQLGDTLRLVSLDKQQWSWTNSEEVVIVPHCPDTQFKEEFTSQSRGEQISCIKFACDVERPDPIRWLVVQKPSFTTIYEPQLKGFSSEEADRLSANPLVTIRRDQTGGAPQSDFTFRFVKGEAPQLAIIDEAGNWSVWEIGSRRRAFGQRRNSKPALRMSGNIYEKVIPQYSNPPAWWGGWGSYSEHKLLFLSPKRNKARPSSRGHHSQLQDGYGSETTAHGGHDTTADERDPMAGGVLLISNRKAIFQHDLRSGVSGICDVQSFFPKISPVLEDPKILDMARSNLDPSEAFILTRRHLLWVEAKEDEEGAAKVQVVMSAVKHWQYGSDLPGEMRLELSPGTYINGHKGCFVCVRSTTDNCLVILWMVRPKHHHNLEPGQHMWQEIRLEAPSGFIGMAMLPVDRAHQEIKNDEEEEEQSGLAVQLAKAKARFFQILLMYKDLDVSSALCVWSDDRKLKVPPPDVRLYLDEDEDEEEVELRREREEFLPSLEVDRVDFERERDKKEMIGNPKLVDLKIPFSFNKGAWQGLEFGTQQEEDGDGDNGRELKELWEDIPRGPNPERIESMIEAIAAQCLHEDLDRAALPQGQKTITQTTITEEGEEVDGLLPSTQQHRLGESSYSHSQPDYLFSSQFQSSQAFPASSQVPLSSQATQTQTQSQNETGDPTLNTLSQYMHIDPQLPHESKTVLQGPFHWEVGDRSYKINWRPGQEAPDEAMKRAIRRKERAEKRRRKRDKLAAKVLGLPLPQSQPPPPTTSTAAAAGGGEESEFGYGYGSSQMVPVIRASTQPPVIYSSSSQAVVAPPRFKISSSSQFDRGSSMGPVFSSQIGGGGGGGLGGSSSQIRSQVVGGKFGDRQKHKSKNKNKKKDKDKKMSGFR